MNDQVGKVPRPLLAAMLLLPAVQTAVGVYWGWHTPITYPAMKAMMIALPIVIWVAIRRPRAEVLRRVGWSRPNLLRGLAMGAAMGGVILAGYYLVMPGRLDPGPVVAKARALGVLDHYWAMAVFISLGNALFEEYYWRGFLVGEVRAWTGRAVVVCGICGGMFGLHHVFAMLPLFPAGWVAVFTAGTMVAGAAWAWMRVRGWSIWDCYVSHVLADLSIMWIGHDLIRGAG